MKLASRCWRTLWSSEQQQWDTELEGRLWGKGKILEKNKKSFVSPYISVPDTFQIHRQVLVHLHLPSWTLEIMIQMTGKKKCPLLKMPRVCVNSYTVELHLSGRWLSDSAWPFRQKFSYCNFTKSFYGLNFFPNFQMHISNSVLNFIFT